MRRFFERGVFVQLLVPRIRGEFRNFFRKSAAIFVDFDRDFRSALEIVTQKRRREETSSHPRVDGSVSDYLQLN